MNTSITAPRTDDEPKLGEAWGQFRLLDRIGRGTCADAWLALRTGRASFAKLVVLKVLRNELLPGLPDDALEREALSLSRMNHPNVVQVIDFIEHDQRRALVMEYIEGKPLTQVGWPPQSPELTLQIGLRLLHDVLLGLEHVHQVRDHDGSSLGIVHGDISPSNVLWAYTGQAKLIDFGLAQHRGAVETAGGTPRYMAPERLLGDPLTPRADIYGVGVMLWELLARRPLWDGLDRGQTQAASLAGMIVSPLRAQTDNETTQAGATEPWLTDVELACMKALAYFPRDRHSSSAEFAEQLTAAPLASHAEVRAFLEHAHGADRALHREQIAERVKELSVSKRENVHLRSDANGPHVGKSEAHHRALMAQPRRYWPVLAVASLTLGAFALITTSSEPESSWASGQLEDHVAAPPHAPLTAVALSPPSAAITAPLFAQSSAVRAPSIAAEATASPAQMPAARALPRSSGAPAREPVSQPPAPPASVGQASSTPDECSPRFFYRDGIKHFKAACFR